MIQRIIIGCGCGKVDPPPAAPAEPVQTERVSV